MMNWFAAVILCFFCSTDLPAQPGANLFGNNQAPSSSEGSGFIENKGQIKDQNNKPVNEVRFLLSIENGLSVQLRSNGFSYDSYVVEDSSVIKFHRIDISFPGANRSPIIVAEGGMILFHTTDRMKGWNGKFKGIESPIGNYVYLIQGTDMNGDVLLKGSFQLIR